VQSKKKIKIILKIESVILFGTIVLTHVTVIMG